MRLMNIAFKYLDLFDQNTNFQGSQLHQPADSVKDVAGGGACHCQEELRQVEGGQVQVQLGYNDNEIEDAKY
jgi:hypothetical protein